MESPTSVTMATTNLEVIGSVRGSVSVVWTVSYFFQIQLQSLQGGKVFQGGKPLILLIMHYLTSLIYYNIKPISLLPIPV